MTLTELLKSLKGRTTIKTLHENTGLNKGFLERVFRGENTMVKLDKLFEELSRNWLIEPKSLPEEIGFEMTEYRVNYYTGMAKRIINEEWEKNLYVDEILFKMEGFVSLHKKRGNKIRVLYEYPYLKLTTLSDKDREIL